MKKLLTILLATILSVSLVACGGSGGGSTSEQKDKTVDEVKQIMMDKGYNVTDSAEEDLFFEEGLVAVKGIDFDHDDEPILFTYYEFPSTKEIDKLRSDCNGADFEKINENMYAYTEGTGNVIFYIGLGQTHISIVYPFDNTVEVSYVTDVLAEIGLPVK